MKDKFINLNKKSDESTKIKIDIPSRKINLIFIFYGLVILVSNLFSKLLGLTNSQFTKNSNLTGIKIIRNNLFALPIIITILNFIVSYMVFKYYLKTKFKEDIFKNSYFTFIRKLQYFQFFKNLVLTLFCYILYSFLFWLIC